jgi:hypothetical protein
MDAVLITMPDTLREFLIALTVVQELQIQMVHGALKDPPLREKLFTITFRLNEKFKCFDPCLQVISSLVPTFDYSGWNEYTRGEFTNFIDFDFELAKRIAKPNQLHITEAFGAKLGTTYNALHFNMYPGKQPILTPLKLPAHSKTKVTIVEWDDTVKSGFKLAEFITNNYPELVVKYWDSNISVSDVETACIWANDCDVFIGILSEYSFIAASLEKALIEIFPTDEDCYLYHNKNLVHYACTVGNPELAYVWYMWEEMWPDLSESISNTKSREQATLTAQQVSIASNVEEKLLDNQDLPLGQ